MDTEQLQQESQLWSHLDTNVMSDQEEDFFDELSSFEEEEDVE
jgi:hypothetical protein